MHDSTPHVPPLVMFNLDGTLAQSKEPISGTMARLLTRLLDRTKVAVISGTGLPQFLNQVVARLPSEARLDQLYLLPSSGSSLYEYTDGWHLVYEERLTQAEAAKIEEAIEQVAKETGLVDLRSPSYGPRIEYRSGQVTFGALGQNPPYEEKKAWDPDKTKRRALCDALIAKLPDFSIGMGGLTSIDITRQGVDKGYGIRKLCSYLGVAESDALYVGNEFERGGNDESVGETGVKTRVVDTADETKELIASMLSELLHRPD